MQKYYAVPVLRGGKAMTDSEIDLAVSRKDPYFQTINGPRIGGGDIAQGRPGYVVSGIHCSGSVTGRYGVDGISQITVHFTHISQIVGLIPDVDAAP
jgi:hypothetical protein